MIDKFVQDMNKMVGAILNIILCGAAGFTCFALGYAWYAMCLTFVATLGVLLTSIAFFAPIILGAIFAVLYFKRG